MESHHRHNPLAPNPAEPSLEEQCWDNQYDGQDKQHVPHAPLSLQCRLSNLWWHIRQIRYIPLPAVLVLCFLMFYAGTAFQTAEVLPAPGGPQVNVISGGRRTLMVATEKQGVKAVDASAARAVSAADLTESFQNFSLHASGFSKFRPALAPGASGEADMRSIPFQVISWYPRITYYPGFVDKARCEHIIAVAKRHLAPSALAYKPGDSIPESQDVRTSTGTFVSREMDPDGALAWLEEKIAAATHLPVENGEAFNVLRYMPTQHYDSHYDTFDPKDFGTQASQRVATFLTFLSDVEEGGETVFKREGRDGGNRTINDWRSCSDNLGVKVKPKQGDAVLFWSTTADLKLDPHALHGACPVVKGEKWSAAKWLHEKPLRQPVH